MNANPDDGDPSSSIIRLEDFETAFDPRAYLDQYYGEIDFEDDYTARFIVSALSKLPRNLRILEFGGGPVLAFVAALAKQAREIHFSDYVQANLHEVRRWLDSAQDAFDWRPHIRLTLEREGITPTSQAVARRESLMRRKVTRLLYCDATSRAPLGTETHRYDLVSALYCTDVCVLTAPEWFQVMRNVDTLVRPGGWLMLGVITGTLTYSMAEKRFPHADVTADDVRRAYHENDYDSGSLILETLEVARGRRDYSGLLMAIARKRR